MTDERWQEIVGKIKDGFELLSQTTQNLPEEHGPGTVEVIEFVGPLGRMKVERTTQPLILDKKIISSKRIGSQATVTYVYSDTEKTHKFKAFCWRDAEGSWVEMAMERPDSKFF